MLHLHWNTSHYTLNECKLLIDLDDDLAPVLNSNVPMSAKKLRVCYLDVAEHTCVFKNLSIRRFQDQIGLQGSARLDLQSS